MSRKRKSRYAPKAEQATKAEPQQNTAQYPTFQTYFQALAAKYNNLSPEAMYSAISRTALGSMYTNSPDEQNRRVKGIQGKIGDYSRKEVSDFLHAPTHNERELREASKGLENTAYPYYKIRRTYQDLLTYRNYVYPAYLEKGDAKKTEFEREWRMVEKLREEIKPESAAHKIVGECVRDGKVFYYPRVSIDKSHNKVNYAFMQQLPEDYVKIVGFNNVSKYTVAFDLMYFMQPGTDWTQFGDLFEPYISDFASIVTPRKTGAKKIVCATKDSNASVDLYKYNEIMDKGGVAGNPEVYGTNSQWFYWVTLPPDKVWCFEGDDTTPLVTPMLCGLMLSMADIARYEGVQLEIVANPLVSIVTGEIPYLDEKSSPTADGYKLSPSGIDYFSALFYQMLSANNTSGIGIYFAPASNLKLQQLQEAPNGGEIASNGYAYSIKKSGMSAILPITDEPRAGLADISLRLESRNMQTVYRTFETMMNTILSSLNLTWDWRFVMFGSIATDKEELESMRKSMEMGILPDLFRYNALLGRSVLDDVSMSNVIDATGVLNLRKPLITSYSAKHEAGSLPPKTGRPETDGITSEGKEADADDYGDMI